ncbi:MAG: SBBP repeat-containing protein [Bryobacteraceae bacterium]
MKTHLYRHAAPLTLAAITIACIVLRGGPPPNKPCDGEWVWKTHESGGGSCGAREEYSDWECESNRSAVNALPLSFEPNNGQAPAAYQYVSHSRSLAVALDDGDADLTLRGPDGAPITVRLHLDGASQRADARGEKQLPGVANYFLGSDPSRWRTNIPSYSRVRFRDVYPGIDIAYYGTDGELEHDFIVRPGADPARIRMELAGADAVRVESDGSVSAVVRGVTVTWRRPELYQIRGGQRRSVTGRYRGDGGNRLAFEVDGYDKAADLVIDPVVAYVSYFGRSSADTGGRVVVDSAGNAYTAGITFDGSFPVTPGAPSVSKGTFGDILITKFNPSGSAVLYSTHIGGANAEGALGLAIDGAGNLYLAGSSDSDDYPVTAGAIKPYLQPPGAPDDPLDCVVTKLNAAGNAILYSTYLGGTGVDACMAVAVDSQSNAYVTGRTTATKFPVSDDAAQRLPRGAVEGFAAKINPQATALVYSTLFGGTRDEAGYAIAVDSQGNAYVAGYTTSSFGFPVTTGALQTTWGGAPTLRGPGDGFVFKINPTGSAFVYSTYLGGNRDDNALGIAVDTQGNAYVTGHTASPNFRTTDGAFQKDMKGAGGNTTYPGGDAYVVKLNPAGTGLLYSTLIGGAKDDVATAIAIDAAGNAYIAGSTLSSDFPVSQDAMQKTYGGFEPTEYFPTGDAFLAHVNPTGSALIYSTYIGGSGSDLGLGVAVDRFGGIYVSGSTLSQKFPVTAGAAQTTYGGSSRQVVPFGDVFMARFGTPIVDPSTPAIRGFGSAANNAAVSVSPGEWIVITGTNLGPAARVNFSAGQDGSVATTLAGTRVYFDDVPAPVFYASAASVQVAAPFALADKSSTQVTVEVNGRKSAALTVPVTAAKPTLFTVNGQGAGQASAVNLADGSANNGDAPVQPGGWVSVSFTGGGAMSPGVGDGQVVPDAGAALVSTATVSIGGRDAEVSYAGGAMGQVAGLSRADFKIPEDIDAGDLEVIVTVAGAKSQSGVTVSVRAPAPAVEGVVKATRTKRR